MLWLRAAAFTVLQPAVVGLYIPYLFYRGTHPCPGLWSLGWLAVALGAGIYLACMVLFLLNEGTPAIFFTRPVRALFGEEPAKVVRGGLYRFTRNPMYVGLITCVSGQAIVFASFKLAFYVVAMAALFHLDVVFLEEPHLRKERGPAYVDYCRTVPRWFGPRHAG